MKRIQLSCLLLMFAFCRLGIGCSSGTIEEKCPEVSCPTGQWCDNGLCVPCSSNEHCGSECRNCLMTGNNKACVNETTCGCQDKEDCTAGESCQGNNQCTGCTPDCAGKCGGASNGCNGTCSGCPSGTCCVGQSCQDNADPSRCGDDCTNCAAQGNNHACVNGTCGCQNQEECAAGEICQGNNQCSGCISECAGKCGGAGDGCNGSCSACSSGFCCVGQSCQDNQAPAHCGVDCINCEVQTNNKQCIGGVCGCNGVQDCAPGQWCFNSQCCTQDWRDDPGAQCGCAPTACAGCDGTILQRDGCGNTRDWPCSLPSTGCAGACCNGICCGAGMECCNGSCNARCLRTFDVRGPRNDTLVYEKKVFAATLQGLVNRSGPRLYLYGKDAYFETAILGRNFGPEKNFNWWSFGNGGSNNTTAGQDYDGTNSCIALHPPSDVASANIRVGLNPSTRYSFAAYGRVAQAGSYVFGRLHTFRNGQAWYLGTDGQWSADPAGTYHHALAWSSTTWTSASMTFSTLPDTTEYYVGFFADAESYIDTVDVVFQGLQIEEYWLNKFRSPINSICKSREFGMWNKGGNASEDTTIGGGQDGDSSCLKLDRSGGTGVVSAEYFVNLAPGRQHTFRAYGKHTGTCQLNGRIYYRLNGITYYLGNNGQWDASGGGPYHHALEWNDDSEWALHSMTFVTPEAVTDYWVAFFSDAGTGTGAIDNVEVSYSGWLADAPVISLQDVGELIDSFKGDLDGVVAWDGEVDATVNVATTAAGVMNAAVVEGGSALHQQCNAAGLPTLLDLRGMFTGIGTIPGSSTPSTGSKKCDAYLWAVQQYLATGLSDPTLLAYYEDAFSRRPESDWPDYTLGRDYVVMNKGFAFDLSPYPLFIPRDDPGQALGTDTNTFRIILDVANQRTGGNRIIRCLGFIPWPDKYSTYGDPFCTNCNDSESKFVYLLSAYNAVNDAVDLHDAANMTVHSQAPTSDRFIQNPRRHLAPQNRRYISFLMGDYSPPDYAQMFLAFQWEHRRRGEMAFGWTLNPNNSMYFKDIYEYLYLTKGTTDTFSPGPSGAGYFYPNNFDPANTTEGRDPSGYPSGVNLLREWNEDWYQRSNISVTGQVWNPLYHPSSSVILTDAVRDAYQRFSADGLIYGYRSLGSNDQQLYQNMPLTAGDLVHAPPDLSVPNLVANIEAAAAGPMPTFTVIWSWDMSPNQVYEIYRALQEAHPDEYEAVEPATVLDIIRSRLGGNSHYRATFLADTIPTVMTAGQTYENLKVTVRNEGTDTWLSAGNFYQLGAHLADHRPAPDELPALSNAYPIRVRVSRDVPPGESEMFVFSMVAPSQPGAYFLQLDLVQEAVTWFESQHNLPWLKLIQIQ